MGFLGLGCCTILCMPGISYLTSQIAAIINYMWPIMIVLFSCFILKEKLTARKTSAMWRLSCGHAPDMPAGIVFSFCKGQCRRHAVAVLRRRCALTDFYSALNKKYDYDQCGRFSQCRICCDCTDVRGDLRGDVRLPAHRSDDTCLDCYRSAFCKCDSLCAVGDRDEQRRDRQHICHGISVPVHKSDFRQTAPDEHITALSLLGLVFIVGGVLNTDGYEGCADAEERECLMIKT